MTRHIRRAVGLAVLAIALPGCLLLKHPGPELPCDSCQTNESLPVDPNAGVYIFFVNGNDPFGIADLKGVRDYVAKLGFPKTYYGEINHEGWMAEEIVCIHRDYPGSRFIVVGYEYGADSARRIAQAGLNRGAPIDLLLFLEPRGAVYNVCPSDAGIARTVVIQKKSLLEKISAIEGAELITVPSKHRFDVPTRPEVVELISSEAALSASQVPMIVFAPEPIPALLDETAPTPRPVSEPKDSTYDEWDFLKLLVQRNENGPRSVGKPQPIATNANRIPKSVILESPYNSRKPLVFGEKIDGPILPE